MINKSRHAQQLAVNRQAGSTARVWAAEPIRTSVHGFISAISTLRFQDIDQEIAKQVPSPRSLPIPWKLLNNYKIDEQ